MIKERLSSLRREMKKESLDYYIVSDSDFHNSEYVGEHFKCRKYMTGFTGSNGTLLLGETEALLWTDGRYFLQAEKELEGTGITLCRSGEPGVPTIREYLCSIGGKKTVTVGFNGRVTGFMTGKNLETDGVTLKYDIDLVGRIWSDRPAMVSAPISIFTEEYAGQSAGSKLSAIRNYMWENGCGAHLLTSLDDIAWILNLRGNDIACNPVFLAYLIVFRDSAILFCNPEAVDNAARQYLNELNVIIMPYGSVYGYLAEKLPAENNKLRILADKTRLTYSLVKILAEHFETVNLKNPSEAMKAAKNDTEKECIRKANIIDGVAMVRFLCWLDGRLGSSDLSGLTELSVSEKLLEFRKQSADFVDVSFETIAAYGPHGAIVHYEPTPETDIPVTRDGFLLVDSGAHYIYGTTDITRTIPTGDLPYEFCEHYTAVLRGNIALASAVFPHGVSGANLDVLARLPLWQSGLDFNHGTGHGIGFMLNVHEGPQNISWSIGKRAGNTYPLAPGMLISDEPGVYIAQSHGIRIENDIMVVPAFTNEYGSFYGFEVMTLCPIDLRPVITEKLTYCERDFLNRYHQTVFERLSPFLENNEKEWLKQACKPI